VGISQDYADAVHRNPEHASHNLRGKRFRSLSLLGDTGLTDYRTLRIEPHRDAILRGYFRAAYTIKRGAGIGDLDEAGDADAAMDVPCPQGRLLRPQRVVVHHLDKLGQRRMVRQLLEAQT